MDRMNPLTGMDDSLCEWMRCEIGKDTEKAILIDRS